MKTKEFKKMIKEMKPDDIKSLYMTCKIYLTEKQLDQVCKMGEHHGGCGFKYSK